MRTISHHWPRSAPRDDFQALCGYCGVQYRRSELVRDRAGVLACRRDVGGDVVTISEENAAGAMRPQVQLGVADGGQLDHLGDPDPVNPNPPTPTYPP